MERAVDRRLCELIDHGDRRHRARRAAPASTKSTAAAATSTTSATATRVRCLAKQHDLPARLIRAQRATRIAGHSAEHHRCGRNRRNVATAPADRDEIRARLQHDVARRQRRAWIERSANHRNRLEECPVVAHRLEAKLLELCLDVVRCLDVTARTCLAPFHRIGGEDVQAGREVGGGDGRAGRLRRMRSGLRFWILRGDRRRSKQRGGECNMSDACHDVPGRNRRKSTRYQTSVLSTRPQRRPLSTAIAPSWPSAELVRHAYRNTRRTRRPRRRRRDFGRDPSDPPLHDVCPRDRRQLQGRISLLALRKPQPHVVGAVPRRTGRWRRGRGILIRLGRDDDACTVARPE